MKRQWWTQAHYCDFFCSDFSCDFQTEDEVEFDNHKINPGIEEGEKRYVCPNEWCEEWITRSLVSL